MYRYITGGFGTFFIVLLSIIVWNFVENGKKLAEMMENESEFRSVDMVHFEPLETAVSKLPNGYAVFLLNRYALAITLNWLCNVKHWGIADRLLFFVLDEESKNGLEKFYPEVKIVQWNSPSIRGTFLPYDSTYMSFFLMRTNLIQALQTFGKDFWMLQADTLWVENLFVDPPTTNAHILLDQQGYEGTAEARKQMMNGANFLVPTGKESRHLVARWLDWQKWIYITDPDIVKMFCLRKDFHCDFIHHRVVSGWEWIYGEQKNHPKLIQMDGETEGNKENVLKKYGFWFLDDKLQCKSNIVQKAIDNVKNGKVPRIFTTSKARQWWILKLGEILNRIPVFGHFSSIYGGIASLYVQIF